ncbi:alpha/beta fold hydrolase [Kutzneria albida]|uniref:AB hydrolase-1 domain-containing protein n=1 Tax=Kutzneria albida DSM 43870 TaxID=1449976 RepID=W5WRW8_9PSEU|nr:hypothetical protein KALB_7557 [Kutzneria albida DSM 43870]
MGDVHLTEQGSGTPLVLLHAYPVDSRMWDGVRGPLAERVRLITPDQRGLGRSPLGQAPPDLDVVAEDLLRDLDRLGVQRFVLGGCSMGGYVAMAVLRRAAERVTGLVLADTKAVADTEQARAGRLAVAERAESEGTAGWLADSFLPNGVGTTTAEQRPEVVSALRELIESQPPSGVAWAQRAMAARPDSTELLAAVDVPVLAVVGAEDALMSPEVVGGLVPGATFAVLPGCGHLPPLEDPAAFARTVLDWLPG